MGNTSQGTKLNKFAVQTVSSSLFLTGCYRTYFCHSSSSNQNCLSCCSKAANRFDILPSKFANEEMIQCPFMDAVLDDLIGNLLSTVNTYKTP